MSAAATWSEAGLDLSALLLPSLLAIVPHGAAPLAGFAGLCAAGLIAANPPYEFRTLRSAAAILGALVLWGALSAAWSIDPWRSIVIAARLAGLFAAALALAAAANRLTVPWRLTLCFFAGTAIGVALALYDLASAGGLNRYVSIRPFAPPRLNPIAAWLTLFVLPATALLVRRGQRLLALGAAVAMGATIYTLDDTTAKIALGLSVPATALVFLRRGAIARIAAALAMLAILTAPLTLARLAHLPSVFATVDAFKDSAGHRLLIWSFAGDRIAERPLLGWGLDSARAIPGGKVEIRPGQMSLPLHPHDAALQLWLELGAPGAILFALLLGLLWLRLGAAPWPRLFAATAGGSMTAATLIALSGWGIWEEWWLATLGFALFATLVMARTARSRIPATADQKRQVGPATRPPRRGSPAADR
jgi:O-antigen ligase